MHTQTKATCCGFRCVSSLEKRKIQRHRLLSNSLFAVVSVCHIVGTNLSCGHNLTVGGRHTLTSELNFNNMQLKKVPSEQMCTLIGERNDSNNATQVNYLSLAGNQIEKIEKDAFVCVAERLRIVDLSQNQIRNITSDAFESLGRVQVLLLDDNRLDNIPAKKTLSSLRSLRHLSLAGNKISALKNGTFNDDVDNDGSLSQKLTLGKTLLTLDLRSNPLERIEPNAFFGLTNLVTITLSQTKLNGRFGPLAVQTMSSLRNIHLDRSMNLSSIEVNLCTNLPKLATLTLSSNRFEQVPKFDSRCNSLLLIDLSYNLISGHLVEDQFKSMPSLIDLYLGHNLIDTIEFGAFNGLNKLQVLALNNNRLKHIDPKAFVPLSSSIYELNLAHNKQLNFLTNLGLENLSSLKVYGNKHLRELPYFKQAQTLALTYAYHCCDYLRNNRKQYHIGGSESTGGPENENGDNDDDDDDDEGLIVSSGIFWSKLRQILLDKQVSTATDADDTDAEDELEDASEWKNHKTINTDSFLATSDRARVINENNLSETIVWPKPLAKDSPSVSVSASASDLPEDFMTDSWRASRSSKRSAARRDLDPNDNANVAHDEDISASNESSASLPLRLPMTDDNTDGNNNNESGNAADDDETLIDELVEIVAQRRRLHSVANYERWKMHIKESPQERRFTFSRPISQETSRLAEAIASALGSALKRRRQELSSAFEARSKRWTGSGRNQGNKNESIFVELIEVSSKRDSVSCRPVPDAFLPCNDLFEGWWLRAGVWTVFVLGFTGNLLVIIVLLAVRPSSSSSALTSIMWLTHSKRHIDVPRFLVINLAVADLLMALYLGLLAFVDASTYGSFRAHAIKWQHSFGCKLAAFFAVLSSELSVFILAIITLERNYAITNAVHLNRRLSFHRAALIMFIGYAWALCMAILPLEGVSDYRKFSICLPLDYNSNRWSRFYTIALISINSISFLLLFACYLRMYCAIRGSQAWNTNDLRIAKRMSTLVLTDFLCWAPILCVAIASLFGHHLVGSDGLKALTIFVLPLNSVANPFLYAITTKKFKRDLRTLLCRTRSILGDICNLLIRSGSGNNNVNVQIQNTKSILVQARPHLNGCYGNQANKLLPSSMMAGDRHRRCCVIDREQSKTTLVIKQQQQQNIIRDSENYPADAWRSSKRYRRRCHVHLPPLPPEIHIYQHNIHLASSNKPSDGPMTGHERQMHAHPGVDIDETLDRSRAGKPFSSSFKSANSGRLLAACVCRQSISPVTPPVELVTSPTMASGSALSNKPKIVLLDTLEPLATNDEQVITSNQLASELVSNQNVNRESSTMMLDKKISSETLSSCASADQSKGSVMRTATVVDRARSAESSIRNRLDLSAAPRQQTISCQAILVLSEDSPSGLAPTKCKNKVAGAACCQDKARSASACGFRTTHNEYNDTLRSIGSGLTVVTRCASSSYCTKHLKPRLEGFLYKNEFNEKTRRDPACSSCDSVRSITIANDTGFKQQRAVGTGCCCQDLQDYNKQRHLSHRLSSQQKFSSERKQQQSTNSISRLLINPIARAWSSLHLLSAALHGGSSPTEEAECCGKDMINDKCLSQPTSSFVEQDFLCEHHSNDDITDEFIGRNKENHPAANNGNSINDKNDNGEKLNENKPYHHIYVRRTSRSCDAISSAAINEVRDLIQIANDTTTTGATTSSSYDYYDDRKMLLDSTTAAVGFSNRDLEMKRAKERGANMRPKGSNDCVSTKLGCARCRSWSPALLRDKIEDCLRKITGPHSNNVAYPIESTDSRDLTGCATESSNLIIDHETDIISKEAEEKHNQPTTEKDFCRCEIQEDLHQRDEIAQEDSHQNYILIDETSGATLTTMTSTLGDSTDDHENCDEKPMTQFIDDRGGIDKEDDDVEGSLKGNGLNY